MIARKGVQHIGIAHPEGQSVARFPSPAGVGHIHDGVVGAAAHHFYPVVQRDQGGGIADVLTAQCQNGPQSAALIFPGDGLTGPVFGSALGGRGLFVDLHDFGGEGHAVLPQTGEGDAAPQTDVHGVGDAAAQAEMVDARGHLIDPVAQKQQIDGTAAGNDIQPVSDSLSALVIAFGIARYSKHAVLQLRNLRQRGYRIVSFTDRHDSPYVDLSDYYFFMPLNCFDFLDSYTAGMTLINALLSNIGLQDEQKLITQLRARDASLEGMDWLF